MTKMEMFTAMLSLSNTTELTEAIQHEIDLLMKRKETPNKPDPRTVENASLKLEILSVLTAYARPMNIDEVVESISGEYTNPVTRGRVSALLTQLKTAGKVERTEVKRIAYFAIKEVDGE